MSVNKNQPHIHVLPEDDANRQLATGFHKEIDLLRQQRMRVLEVAGGWLKVVERFKIDHVAAMRRYPERRLVLLIDFDGQPDRLGKVWEEVPDDLKDRVFILGAWNEPEALRKSKTGLGSSYEFIGEALAKDCREETDTKWGHALLRHNSSEVERLREHVRPILFQSI